MENHTHHPAHPTHHTTDDPEARALEEEITRGTVHDPEFGRASGHGSSTAAADAPAGNAPDGIRAGTLVWGIIALLVALWSLSTTVLDWSIDPALVAICLAALGGVVLVAGGIAGAARHRTR